MANLSIVIVARNMASGALRDLHSELGGLDTQAGVASRGIGGLQTAVRAGLAAAATVGTMAVGALGAGLVLAANKAGDFEAQINILTVAARQSGTGMDDLRAAAMRVGSDVTLVGISSSEAADAMTNFYRAGMTTTDVFGDLQGYLSGTVPLSGALRASIDLAAASELDLAQASNIVSVAMATFGLNAGDAAGIANSLVGAADASQASVSGLAEALQNVGPIAAQMGISLNDTNIALALLSSRGIEGSEAGTSLRSMLLNLASGTPATTAALQALNVALYDQQGNMLPLPNIIGQLQTAFSGLTQEQQTQYAQTLAGTYGLRALNTLVGEGLPGWDAMATAVSNAATAQEIAAVRTQGFNAAMENLSGVIETFLISVGTPLIQNFLTPGIQWLSAWIGSLTTLAPTTDSVSAAFQTLLGYGQNLLSTIQSLLGPVIDVIGQFVSWKDILIVLGGVIASVLIGGLVSIVSAAAPVILVFAGLVAAVAVLRMAWEENFGGIRTAIETLVNSVIGFFDGLGTYVQGHSSEVMGWMTTAWTTIQQIVSGVVAAISSIVSSVLGAVASFVDAHGQEIQTFLIGAWQQIGTIINLVLQVINQTVVPILQGIASFIAQHSTDIQAFLTTAWTAIRTIIETVLGVVEGVIRTVLAVIQGDWSTAWTSIRDVSDTLLQGIITVIQTLLTPIVDWIRDRLEDIRQWFETKWGQAKQAVEDKIQEILTSIRTWLQDTLTTIQNFDLRAAARGLFQTVIAGIGEKVGEALAAVATFLDNVFAAIEGFDLQAAARTFFGTTLPGIGEKIGEALDRTDAWLSDTFDRIREKDLQPAARAFFGTTLPGIGEKIGEALDRVSIWLSDTFDRIREFDLKAAAKTLFGTIIPGLLDKARDILNKVGDLLSDIAERIREKTFKSETMTAIQTVIVGIIEKAVLVLGQIQTMLTNVANAIRNFSLVDAGKSLIQGFIDGIASMVGAAIAAAVNVVQQAIAAAWAAVQPGSPSRVGREIGANLAGAIGIGISDMASMVVRAMRELMGQVNVAAVQEAAEIAEAINTIIDSINNLINSAAALAAFQVPQGMTAAIDEIVLMIRYIITVFVAATRSFSAEAVAAAADFADAASSILDVMSSAIDVVTALSEYTEVNIQSAARNLSDQILFLAQELVRIATQIGPVALAAAATAGELLEQVLVPWEAGVDVITALADYTYVRIGPAAQMLADQMMGLARHLVRVATEIGPEALAAAATAGELFEQVMAPWQAGVDVITALADYTYVRIGPAAQMLADQMMGLARHLVRVATEIGPEALAAAATAGELLEQAMAPWEAGVDVIAALAEYTYVRIGPAAESLRLQMQGLASKLRWIAETLGPETLQAAATTGELLEAVLAPWQAGIDVMTVLAAYTSVRIGPAAETLRLQMQGLASKLRWIAETLGPETLAAAATTAQQLIAVTSVWQPAMDVMAALAAYVPQVIGPLANILTDQIRGLANKFRQLMTDLADLGNLTVFTGQVEDFLLHVIAVVERMNDLQGALSEPIDLYPAGFNTGRGWITGVINGLLNRMPNLEDLMDYIRGLFPSSPAKYGPWRRLPDGAVVGTGFGRGLALGLSAESDRVTAALSTLYKGMQMVFPSVNDIVPSVSTPPAPIYTTDPPQGYNGARNKPGWSINISNNVFSSRQDIDYLIDELDNRMRLRGAYRL